MAATYEPIATTTLSSNQATVTFGASNTLSQAYTDLILVVTGKSASGTNLDFGFRFNGDTGTNYSRTYLYGNGTSAASGRDTSATYIANLVLDSTNISVNINHFMNYSNTTTYKSVLFKYGLASYATGSHIGLWRNTNAITQIDCLNLSGTNFASGSTFTLYGIKAA